MIIAGRSDKGEIRNVWKHAEWKLKRFTMHFEGDTFLAQGLWIC